MDFDELNCQEYERWISLNSKLIMNDKDIVDKHLLLIRTSIEYPCDLTEQESKELTDNLPIFTAILNEKVTMTKAICLFCFLLRLFSFSNEI